MNPLSKFTKIPNVYVKLSSNNVYKYSSDVMDITSSEIGVCARSARDEIMFNNPDGLMNGQAVVEVIKNNVPAIKNPNKLIVSDVEQLLIAIKVATKEEEYSVESDCPECGKHGAFDRNLQSLLDNCNYITELPHLILKDTGLIIRFRPLLWEERSKFSQDLFMCHKRGALLDSDTTSTDEEKIKEFSSIFESMTEVNFEMMVSGISSIETPSIKTDDGLQEGVLVTDSSHIREWLGQQPRNVLEMIRKELDSFNKIGVPHELPVECSDCQHQWELKGLVYDPSDFFVRNFSSLTAQKS